MRDTKGRKVARLLTRLGEGEGRLQLEAVGGTGHRSPGRRAVRAAPGRTCGADCVRGGGHWRRVAAPAGVLVGVTRAHRSTVTLRPWTGTVAPGSWVVVSTTLAAVSMSAVHESP